MSRLRARYELRLATGESAEARAISRIASPLDRRAGQVESFKTHWLTLTLPEVHWL